MIALIAVLFILAAYVLSFMSKSPITAVFLLLLSLPLILIGTYGLFIAGGTVILSAMKRRGTFYYKKKHFLP
ncbi:MAG: ABC transporter permease, partial [Anaerovoracaceae bacterium]